MAFRLLGWSISKDDSVLANDISGSPVRPQFEDGGFNIDSNMSTGYYLDMDYAWKSEEELINRYRTMALNPELDQAISEIVDEAIIHDSTIGKIVTINTDELKQPEPIKKRITEEFDGIIKLLNFNRYGDDIFRSWYIDGRLHYYCLLDNDSRNGIKSVIKIDSRKVSKVRQVKRRIDPSTGANIVDGVEEYFTYKENLATNTGSPITTIPVIGNTGTAGLVRLTSDSVVFVPSGIYDPIKNVVLGFLQKAIRPLNMARYMEDATVIFKVTRAPARRAFYIDVGGMGKTKAEQYMKSVMTNYRNKLNYNAETGEVIDSRRFMSMLEDFFIPRRNGEKTTEIVTLQGESGTSNMDDVLYFEKKLYKALGLPPSRIENQSGSFSLGRSTEITRDEIRFNKFIKKLRNRFNLLFDELMKRQLVLKGVCTLEEWEEFRQDIYYTYNEDNNFAELKEAELLTNRVNLLNAVVPFLGKFFSMKWINQNVLHLNEEEAETMQEEIAAEPPVVDPNAPPEEGQGNGDGQGSGKKDAETPDIDDATQAFLSKLNV